MTSESAFMKSLPDREGWYEILRDDRFPFGPKEIEVYRHPIKGLACFAPDYGSEGTHAIDDATDCHVSVQCTGLPFGKWLRPLGSEAAP